MKQLNPNIESQIQIYTTGTFLKPIKIIDSKKKRSLDLVCIRIYR